MTNGKSNAPQQSKKRTRIPQTDVPRFSLDEAIRIPKAISENYAGKPTSPLRIAKAIELQPNSGHFRNLCGSAIAYGLTKGGPNAEEISIEPLGFRIVRPLEEGDDLIAQREALLKPRIIGEFLRKYDSSPLPREEISLNVLEDMGVPRSRAEEVLYLILKGATSADFITEIKNKEYVDLSSLVDTVSASDIGEVQVEHDVPVVDLTEDTSDKEESEVVDAVKLTARARKVFISHGKDKSMLEPIKKLLSFGELEPVISVERQSVSQPVPDKVMNDMRVCGAAIIHVEADQKLIDSEANEHVVVNPNVLIEIGAAMALYGRRFILLVRQGIELPSNLQGLYEVRYSGEKLDGEATLKLLEAINDIKNHPLPK